MKARPALRDDGSVYACFYATNAYITANSAHGETRMGLMMSRLSIDVSVTRDRRAPPTIVRCTPCKVGMVSAHGMMVMVTCPHGTWARESDTRIEVLGKLGNSNLFVCDLCGGRGIVSHWDEIQPAWFLPQKTTVYSPPPPPTLIETLRFCGRRCLTQARGLPFVNERLPKTYP